MQEYPTIASKALTVLMQFATSANMYSSLKHMMCKERKKSVSTEDEIKSQPTTHTYTDSCYKKTSELATVISLCYFFTVTTINVK